MAGLEIILFTLQISKMLPWFNLVDLDLWMNGVLLFSNSEFLDPKTKKSIMGAEVTSAIQTFGEFCE